MPFSEEAAYGLLVGTHRNRVTRLGFRDGDCAAALLSNNEGFSDIRVVNSGAIGTIIKSTSNFVVNCLPSLAGFIYLERDCCNRTGLTCLNLIKNIRIGSSATINFEINIRFIIA